MLLRLIDILSLVQHLIKGGLCNFKADNDFG